MVKDERGNSCKFQAARQNNWTFFLQFLRQYRQIFHAFFEKHVLWRKSDCLSRMTQKRLLIKAKHGASVTQLTQFADSIAYKHANHKLCICTQWALFPNRGSTIQVLVHQITNTPCMFCLKGRWSMRLGGSRMCNIYPANLIPLQLTFFVYPNKWTDLAKWQKQNKEEKGMEDKVCVNPNLFDVAIPENPSTATFSFK